jgi:hypothetical protein
MKLGALALGAAAAVASAYGAVAVARLAIGRAAIKRLVLPTCRRYGMATRRADLRVNTAAAVGRTAWPAMLGP